MSIDATIWAWAQPHITPTQKLVLLSMADRAGEDHTCWPSIKRLCIDTGLKVRAVQNALGELVKLNLVQRIQRTDDTNIYVLMGVVGREKRASHATTDIGVESPATLGGQEVQESTDSGTTCTPAYNAPLHIMRPCIECTPAYNAPNPRISCAYPPHLMRGESPIEPKENLPPRARDACGRARERAAPREPTPLPSSRAAPAFVPAHERELSPEQQAKAEKTRLRLQRERDKKRGIVPTEAETA